MGLTISFYACEGFKYELKSKAWSRVESKANPGRCHCACVLDIWIILWYWINFYGAYRRCPLLVCAYMCEWIHLPLKSKISSHPSFLSPARDQKRDLYFFLYVKALMKYKYLATCWRNLGLWSPGDSWGWRVGYVFLTSSFSIFERERKHGDGGWDNTPWIGERVDV